MEISRIFAGVAIYLIVGLMTWTNTKLENNISIKTTGHAKWREPIFFKVLFLWFPFLFLSQKNRLREWIYK